MSGDLPDGRNENNVPSTPDALEEAFRKSSEYAILVRERDAYEAEQASDAKHRDEFEAAVLADKRKAVAKKSVYTVSFYTQVGALTRRQILLKLQDRTGLIVSFCTAVIIAIITGSVYLKLPTTHPLDCNLRGAVSCSCMRAQVRSASFERTSAAQVLTFCTHLQRAFV